MRPVSMKDAEMKTFTSIILILFALTQCVAAPEGGKDRQRDRGVSKIAGTPAQTVININNVTSWVRSDAFFDWAIEGSWNGTFPKGTIGGIFAQGIVWGGFVNDGQTPALRVGGATYRTGSQAGAILTDPSGRVIGAEDPTAPDVRIFRVRPDFRIADLRDDASQFFQVPLDQVSDDQISQVRLQYETDATEWPFAKGAPYDDVDSNGVYDPAVDIPGIPGADQTVWFVSNDLGGNATVYGAPSIGLEIQMTLWAYTSELFANVIFERARLIYKGTRLTPANATITNMFITQWSDPDLGNFSDDFVGTDTTLSLGYVYNATTDDAQYRGRFGLPAPAMGYDFLQGVRVPGAPTDTAIFDLKRVPGFRNLPMTTFTFFAAGSQRSDPDLGRYSGTLQFYNLMRGCEPRPEFPSCVPLLNQLGQPTRFELSGDPVTGQGDIDGRVFPPGDRRLVMATGPFNMARGDTQEVVVALIGGLGGDNLSSISILKNNDRFAQSAYDSLFRALPGAPPPPIVRTVELDREIVLNWGSDTTQLRLIESVERQGWRFEGYNVYQLPSPTVTPRFPDDVQRIGTFDLINNIRTITNRVFDPTARIFVNRVRAIGSDAGVQRFLRIRRDGINGRPLVNGQTYYFAVTAYSFNPDTNVDFSALESRVQVLAVVPQPVRPGVRYSAGAGDTVKPVVHDGPSDGRVVPIVVDPTNLTGRNYEVTFDTLEGEIVWNLTDLDSARVLFSRLTNQSGDEDYPIVDGMQIKVLGPPPGMKDFEIPSGERRWSSVGGNFGFEGFDGAIGMAFDHWFSSSTITPDRLRNVLFRFASTDANGNFLNPADTNISFGYRYLRRATFPPARPEFAPFILNPTAGYAFQNYTRSVPFAAFDVDSDPPRRLMVGFLENNVEGGSVDGRYWPPDASGPSNVATDGPREWFFVFDIPYSETADPSVATDILNVTLPIIWAGTPSRRTGALFQTGDEFLIVANRINTIADRFTFRAPSPFSSSGALAQRDVEQINVFPNPYYGINAAEINRLQKFVTFSHLPQRATIRVFNLAGVLVRVIEKDDQSQFLRWDLRNNNNLPVASGIYIVHVDMPDPVNATKVLKMAIVQEEQILRTY